MNVPSLENVKRHDNEIINVEVLYTHGFDCDSNSLKQRAKFRLTFSYNIAGI